MRILVAFMLTAVAFAGCGGESTSDTPLTDPITTREVNVDENTGAIIGVVLDVAVKPIAGATVTVLIQGANNLTQETDLDGVFVFDGLAPGSYFVTAEKLGHFKTQTNVEVVAGVEKPAGVRLLLEIDEANRAYVRFQTFEGFIECTSSALVVCGAPNLFTGENATNDKYTPTIYYDPGADFIQTEMAWESSQDASDSLYFEMEVLDPGCTGDTFLNNSEGASPIYATVSARQVEEHSIGGEDCGIYHSVFSGDASGDPSGADPPACCGATVQQDFTFFIHEFHAFTPFDGWRFTAHGDCSSPEECGPT